MKRTEDEMKTHGCFSHCLRPQIREMAGKMSVCGSRSLPIDLLSGKSSSKQPFDVVNMNFAQKKAMIPPSTLCGENQEDGNARKRSTYQWRLDAGHQRDRAIVDAR